MSAAGRICQVVEERECGIIWHLIAIKGGHEPLCDPSFSRLVCPACEHGFVVGLVLWPTNRSKRKALPRDQIPLVPGRGGRSVDR